jgi:small redox-active disulfide protein 2
MDIKILGMGCARCRMLEQKTRNAAAELDIEADIQKVEDLDKIMAYGIMHTPGLVINGKMIFSGRVPSFEELKQILRDNM